MQTSLNATGLIAGTYHLTVTDANNCAKVQTVNITQPDDIVITDLEKTLLVLMMPMVKLKSRFPAEH
jgi:hypothetical protein